MRMLRGPTGKLMQAVAFALACLTAAHGCAWAGDFVDLNEAVVVVRPGDLPNAEKAAATVLIEELEARSGIRLSTSTTWPAGKPVVAISSEPEVAAWGRAVPARDGTDLPESRPEGYRLFVDSREAAAPVVWVAGADPRGALYGVGALLRHLDWAQGRVRVPAGLDIATAPAYPIRGHQLGYRPMASSWDAWDASQFDRHIRELAFFGINSIENILRM